MLSKILKATMPVTPVLFRSNQDTANDKSCTQNFNIITLQVDGRLKGWASVLLKRELLAHEDRISTAVR